jgi:hypothetical protein
MFGGTGFGGMPETQTVVNEGGFFEVLGELAFVLGVGFFVGSEKLFACPNVRVCVRSDASQHFILLSSTLYYILVCDPI